MKLNILLMRRIVFVAFLFVSLINYGQNNSSPSYTISGRIIDNATGNPLEYATVIFRNTDSNEIRFGCVSTKNGKFSIDVATGTYDATVEMLSFKTKKLNLTKVSRNFDLGNIRLDLDTEFLQEVEITASQNAVSIKPNKMVFNVSNDMSASGNTATSILNNIPVVTVDAEGVISLRGQPNVTVMINGKTSAMTKTEALKSLPAEIIERIEVISNPGAAYRADAMGIINILLKKGKDNGLNASSTITGGHKGYYGGLVTLNHKTDKINFFTNGSYYHRNPVRVAEYMNEYTTDNQPTASISELSNNNNKARVFYGTIGATFSVSDKTDITASLNFSDINNDGNNETTTIIYDGQNNPFNSNIRMNMEDFSNDIFEYQLSFEQRFAKEGSLLKAAFSYAEDSEKFDYDIKNSSLLFTNESYTIDNELKNTMIDVSFSSPIGEASSINFGYAGEFGNIPFSLKESADLFSLEYLEDVHAAFATFDHESDKFYYELGLRAEFVNTLIDYHTLPDIERSYEDLFPSAYVNMMLSDTKYLYFSYSKSIQRPTYTELQPFEQKISETLAYKGNEQLMPVYADQLEMGYTYSSNKFTLSSVAFYHIYKDYWQEITFNTGYSLAIVPKMITTPMNVGKLNYYGLNLTAQLKAGKNLSLTGNALLSNFDQSGTYQGTNFIGDSVYRDYNHDGFTGSFSLLSQLRIPKLIDVQLNIKHNLISEGPYSTRKAYSAVNVALQREILNKNGTLSLTIDDLFKSIKTKRDRFLPGYFSESIIRNKYRTALLSFTYRFNQSKKEQKIDFSKKDLKPNF